MKYVRGQCYDFALAMLERFPEGELVALGKSKFGADHVGLRIQDKYLDARGAQSAEDFVKPFNYQVEDIEPIARDDVEFYCGLAGVPPPYRGNQDIAAARQAAAKVFNVPKRPK
jgi:hypothetical protein